jgi:hypothetical protein
MVCVPYAGVAWIGDLWAVSGLSRVSRGILVRGCRAGMDSPGKQRSLEIVSQVKNKVRAVGS